MRWFVPGDVDAARIDRELRVDEVVADVERRPRAHVDAEGDRVRRRIVGLDDRPLGAALEAREIERDRPRVLERVIVTSPPTNGSRPCSRWRVRVHRDLEIGVDRRLARRRPARRRAGDR